MTTTSSRLILEWAGDVEDDEAHEEIQMASRVSAAAWIEELLRTPKRGEQKESVQRVWEDELVR